LRRRNSGFRLTKRPHSHDARSVPAAPLCQARGQCIGEEECHAPSIHGFGLQGDSLFLLSCFGRLICFYFLACFFRLVARGIMIARTQRHHHTPATAGIRSSAAAQARQASQHRLTLLTYRTADISLFYLPVFTVVHIEMCAVERFQVWYRTVVDKRSERRPSISLHMMRDQSKC
jgi:hypothetical protein